MIVTSESGVNLSASFKGQNHLLYCYGKMIGRYFQGNYFTMSKNHCELVLQVKLRCFVIKQNITCAM